ncbi:MAG: DUF1292 domain-containing protein [Cellulosilyticaceae bacterium]
MDNEKIVFFDETTGEEVLFEIVDHLIVDDCKYILVVDEEDVATIMKETEDDETEVTYVLVEDDAEFQKITLLFMESDEYDVEV